MKNHKPVIPRHVSHERYYIHGDVKCPDDMQWVCRHCGKTSQTKYGFDENNENCSDRGYDGSCVLSAVLCYKKDH